MDAFTIEMRLCDEQGFVDLELLGWMRALGGHPAYEGGSLACTGSAHLGDQHVRCTNDIHRVKAPYPSGTVSPYLGDAVHVATLAAEVESLIADESRDDPNIASVLESVAACHRVAGRILGERWYLVHELVVQPGMATS